jgi:predicted TIM-barrel fold metal-dependent hydrolase
MTAQHTLSRRCFLGAACAALARGADPVIDIHQHTPYSGRTAEQLVAHQRTMGISKSVLLPAGSREGLAQGAGGNDVVIALARSNPKEYVFFANELPDIPQTKSVIEKYLKMGAIGIGEQKFHVDCDSKPMQLIADIAKHHNVPVLMHFQHDTYNLGIERFYRLVAKYPKVVFIGHAQTWWGNIDKNHQQPIMYPKGPVTPGGITDRLLSDYPNVYGDLSAWLRPQCAVAGRGSRTGFSEAPSGPPHVRQRLQRRCGGGQPVFRLATTRRGSAPGFR